MNLISTGILGTLVLCGAAAADPGGNADSDNPGAWLEPMVGEWSVSVEAVPGPGQEPVRAEAHAVARLLGGKWLVTESSGTAAGSSFTWILTLGYDAYDKHFVGTWLDSRQTHLWRYSGTLEEDRTRLVLETEGPIMGNPETSAAYRVVIEIRDDDHWTMHSMILGPDDEWFEFSRIDFRRAE